MSNRRTGKTFRAILRALLSVSEGNNTIFVSRTIAVSKNNFRVAANILEGYMGRSCVDYNGYTITLEKSTLTFISKNLFSPSTHKTLIAIQDLD